MKNVNDQYTECNELIWNLSLFSIKFVYSCCCFFIGIFCLQANIHHSLFTWTEWILNEINYEPV